ncbi:membrane protein [Microbacterium phage Pumpernickel]|uniref:Membrane protein n=1 Tax=Microbacterium phage Pumpernickel TaxID=2885983 RepID=A0AAE8Y6X1_9CAUD|nr:membrane protein [Microbacterium phage Pumpernickel]YP_010755310.1 membrane protein [Microbacterium phage Pumpernickel]UDL15810.1 membrane protein [Microbacterium phage Pumpernickel]UDL16070.1 membrane protein [Microbacterium phage Pumpernickel]
MDIYTLALIACGIGAAFCFLVAGAVATERKPKSNAADMLNLFGITPTNAHEFMHEGD